MRQILLVLVLCVGVFGQNNVLIANPTPVVITGKITAVPAANPAFTGWPEYIINNGDGTATMSNTANNLFTYLAIGQSFTLSNSGTCYDGAHVVTAEPSISRFTFSDGGCHTTPADLQIYRGRSAMVNVGGTLYEFHNYFDSCPLTSGGYTHECLVVQSFPGQTIEWRTSVDGGLTWTNQGFLVPNVGYQQCSVSFPFCALDNPMAGVAPNGDIIVMWTRLTGSCSTCVLDGDEGTFYIINHLGTWGTVKQVTAPAPSIPVPAWITGNGNITTFNLTSYPVGTMGLVLMHFPGGYLNSKTFLLLSCDNGQTWGVGCTANPVRLMDSALPTNETDAAGIAGTNDIVAFSRGCNSPGCAPPDGALYFLYSNDAGMTWTKVQTTFAFTNAGMTLQNQISPKVFCPTVTAMCTVLYAERQNTSAHFSYLRSLTFDPIAAIASPSVLGSDTQLLWSALQDNTGSTGFPDWGYPSGALFGASIALEWYIEMHPADVGRLHNMTGVFATPNGSFVGAALTGALK